jgi:translation initiation factor 4E
MVRPANQLESAWTLWFELRPEVEENKSMIFVDRLKEVCTMDSVEQFHQYYTYMKTPDELPVHATLYIFKDGVRPMWESFPEGGCWSFRLKRDDSRLRGVWDELMMSCVGEGLGSENVAGIVLGSRTKEFVLSVWLKSGQTSEQRFEIVEKLRAVLKLEEGDMLQYKDFHSAIQDDSSRTNAITYRVRPTKSVRTSKRYILPDPVAGSFTFNF